METEGQVEGQAWEDIRLLISHNNLPKERCVAMEGYDPGTSNRAYHLPTSCRAKLHHRRSAHFRHTEDIVDT